MRSLILKLLILTGIYTLSSCNSDGSLCSCGSSCKLTLGEDISCSLDQKALAQRKSIFKDLFFEKASKIEEIDNGFLFTYPDEGKINERLFNFILEEKQCCPFFQYDLTILPYNEGIHFKVSGEEQVKNFLKALVEEVREG